MDVARMLVVTWPGGRDRRGTPILAGPPALALEGDFPMPPSLRFGAPDAIRTTGWAAAWNAAPPPAGEAVMLVGGVVHDQPAYRRYLGGLRDADLIGRFGGRPILHGRPSCILAGDYPESRVTIAIVFPDLGQARGFWTSPDYDDIRRHRDGAADLDVGVWRRGDRAEAAA